MRPSCHRARELAPPQHRRKSISTLITLLRYVRRRQESVSRAVLKVVLQACPQGTKQSSAGRWCLLRSFIPYCTRKRSVVRDKGA